MCLKSLGSDTNAGYEHWIRTLNANTKYESWIRALYTNPGYGPRMLLLDTNPRYESWMRTLDTTLNAPMPLQHMNPQVKTQATAPRRLRGRSAAAPRFGSTVPCQDYDMVLLFFSLLVRYNGGKL